MREVQEAVYSLSDLGVVVLSPADPRVVDRRGEFLFVASDKLRSVRLVQGRHLAAIAASDFLWLVAPDGYVGPSAAMEIGFAVGKQIPVFCATEVQDMTLQEFVAVVSGPKAAIAAVLGRPRREVAFGGLLDPNGAVERAQEGLEALRGRLLGQSDGKEPVGWRVDAEDLLAIPKPD